jgi:DNA-binding response OmpR family regulator
MNTADFNRLLVVEDDPAFARTLVRRLESQGHQVHLAHDGREGMKAIVELEPHLVISDWMMPHVDGLELCRAVKTGLGDAAPYFVLITARDDISARVLALETGADDFLVKPCHEGELAARVRSGLRQVALRAEIRRLSDELAKLRGQQDERAA